MVKSKFQIIHPVENTILLLSFLFHTDPAKVWWKELSQFIVFWICSPPPAIVVVVVGIVVVIFIFHRNYPFTFLHISIWAIGPSFPTFLFQLPIYKRGFCLFYLWLIMILTYQFLTSSANWRRIASQSLFALKASKSLSRLSTQS